MSTEAGQILDNAGPQNATMNAPSTGGANKDVQPAPTTSAPLKEEPISGKLSVLMERERQALNRERMAKAQEEKLRDRLKAIEEFETLKKDPAKIDDLLKNLGWDYDRLTQSKLQDGQVPPGVEIQKLRDELDQLRSQLKQKEDVEVETHKKRVNEAETRAVTDFKTEITDYLKANNQRYELIDFEGAHDLVFDVIDEHYNRTIDPSTGVGKVMSIADASDKVEEHLEKKYLAAKEKNKVKAFWSNVPKPIQQQLEKQRELSQPPRTLTNNLSPQVSHKPKRPPEDQRIQQIIAEHVAKTRSQYAG